ncbi:MAG: hypothetical protein RR090_11945, partial [Niameybacter sp.]|uniref:hypothetical protein n=1 Tax=Niameybacter sp. TaxID=2033640 RepID=UPI002FC7F204
FHLSIMELFLRAIPDAALFIMGTHIFAHIPINKARIIKSILIMALTVYVIRCLPITFGIHTLLGVVATTLLIIIIYKIDLIQSIRATFLTTLVQYISELLNMIWIQLYLGKELEVVFQNPTSKILYGIPSLILSTVILYLVYSRDKRRMACKNDE